MNGYERRRDLETKAIAMANAAIAKVPQNLTLEGPQPGGTFQDPNTLTFVDMHCRLVEGYYAFLLAADSQTTGMWQVPPGDPSSTGPLGPGTPTGQALTTLLQTILQALPQSGNVNAQQAQQTIQQALAGQLAPGPVTNAILHLIPTGFAGDWKTLLPVLSAGFAQLSGGAAVGAAPAAPPAPSS